MKYKESKEIFIEIKKANKILINCHRGPDSDSVGSALALYNILKELGKEVDVICPSDIPSDLKFLEGANIIRRVNFTSFSFDPYDLFLVLDSSSYSQVTGVKDFKKPSLNTIVIDHHYTNDKFGDLNLVDSKVTSTSELLYYIFNDWELTINRSVSECLLTGIMGDTGAFQYPGVGKETLEVAANLISFGADKGKIVYNLYRSIEFREIKLWGKFIENMKIEDGFVWSAISISTYKDFGEYPYAKEDAANLFFPVVKGTLFGIVMVETSENVLAVSLRARESFDVSKIAEEIGGGGHKAAAGARIEDLPFQEAVNRVLSAARKHAQTK